MRDCYLEHTRDRVVAICGHVPRLIPPGSFVEKLLEKSAFGVFLMNI